MVLFKRLETIPNRATQIGRLIAIENDELSRGIEPVLMQTSFPISLQDNL